MDYNPKQLKKIATVEPGVYAFTCIDAREKVSQTGYSYMHVKLEIEVPNVADPFTVYDRLSIHPKALWRLEHFCKCVGRDFDIGKLLPEDCIGKTGLAEVVQGKPNDQGKRFLEIGKYIEKSEQTQDKPVEKPTETTEDDIPF